MTQSQQQDPSRNPRTSSSEKISCNIPLLDGDGSTVSRKIETGVELGRIANLQELYDEDKGSLVALICTAWGLLLRCFTGQDDIGFYVLAGDRTDDEPELAALHAQQEVFRIAFHDQKRLATYIARARTKCATLESRPVTSNFIQADTDSPKNVHQKNTTHQMNTTVWIQGSGSSRSLSAKSGSRTAVETTALQVSESYHNENFGLF